MNNLNYMLGLYVGRLNARVMETAGNAFYGVWNAQVMEAAYKLSCVETAGNGNGM